MPREPKGIGKITVYGATVRALILWRNSPSGHSVALAVRANFHCGGSSRPKKNPAWPRHGSHGTQRAAGRVPQSIRQKEQTTQDGDRREQGEAGEHITPKTTGSEHCRTEPPIRPPLSLCRQITNAAGLHEISNRARCTKNRCLYCGSVPMKTRRRDGDRDGMQFPGPILECKSDG